MKRFTVDRFEGDRVVLECENGDMAVFERRTLPKNIKEGDVLRFDGGSCYLSAEETVRRRKKIRKLMDSLFED